MIHFQHSLEDDGDNISLGRERLIEWGAGVGIWGGMHAAAWTAGCPICLMEASSPGVGVRWSER